MRDEILTYWEMCAREKTALQRGMYFRHPPNVSIFLMSQRPGAAYEDALSPDGTELVYEGHDSPRHRGLDPKTIDQPWFLPSGQPSENAKFARAVDTAPTHPPVVRVYEKLRPGVWSDRGLFELVRYEYERLAPRKVFRFYLRLSSLPDTDPTVESPTTQTRIIPSWVKQQVYKRDRGRCVICGAVDQLHFDHDLPFSKGGTGLTPANVRILCARHNLKKAARIE